jgi:arylsulfatase A-like enzyme
MRASAMGCMGNQQVITPNLDRLAGDGLLVTNCISSHPVCTPYRAQLMTGRYGPSTGVIKNDIRLPDDAAVLPVQLKAAGYATGYIGKWHLAGDRKNPVDRHNRRGWDFWAVRNCSHQHFKPAYWLNDATEPVKVDGWEPDVQTDLAVEYINQRREQRSPFCLMVSYGPPHNPYRAPQADLKRYDKPIEFQPNTVGSDRLADVIRNYYGMVSSLDDCVARIVKALNDAQLADDTVLIFTSDHGDMLGAQGHRLKQRPWEESINVPLIVRYPRAVKAGQQRDWMIDSVDMMPTLLGLAGAKIPDNVQGLNQADLLLGRGQQQRSASLLINTHGGAGPGVDWRGVRTRQWLYAHHAGGDWVMYDLVNDPYQLKNLVDDPAHADRRRQLRQQVQQLRKQFGDDLPLHGDKPHPIKLPA